MRHAAQVPGRARARPARSGCGKRPMPRAGSGLRPAVRRQARRTRPRGSTPGDQNPAIIARRTAPEDRHPRMRFSTRGSSPSEQAPENRHRRIMTRKAAPRGSAPEEQKPKIRTRRTKSADQHPKIAAPVSSARIGFVHPAGPCAGRIASRIGNAPIPARRTPRPVASMARGGGPVSAPTDQDGSHQGAPAFPQSPGRRCGKASVHRVVRCGLRPARLAPATAGYLP